MRKFISFLIVLIGISVAGYAVEPDSEIASGEFQLINALNYHKSMFKAQPPEDLISIQFGVNSNQVAGAEQDQERLTVGVPFAFRPGKDDNIWILDSLNKALKLFNSQGDLVKQVPIGKFGTIVRDFTVGKDDDFWLLNNIEGFIYHIDKAGKLIQEIEGFQGALSIESSSNGGVFVDLPESSAVLSFGKNHLLDKEYSNDGTLALIEDSYSKLLGLRLEEKKVELYLRTLASPASSIVLAEFPLKIDEPTVTYAGAEIIGKDSNGNVYLSLAACNENGAIYMDRLYKCSVSGKILAQKDILTIPFLGPDLPRRKIVTPKGEVITFYATDKEYRLVKYSL